MSFVSDNWQTLTSKNLIENKFVGKYTEDIVLRPDGKTSVYYKRHKGPFSIIIPLEQDKIYMVRQYRYSVSSLSLEFPMGFVPNISPLEIAKQELKEEMGIVAKEYVELGCYWPSAGGTNQEAYVFLAQGLEFGEKEPEEGEFLESEIHTISEVKEMIDHAKIKDAATITAFYYLQSYLKQK